MVLIYKLIDFILSYKINIKYNQNINITLILYFIFMGITNIIFDTSLLNVGKVSIYARIDPIIVKNLNLSPKQTGTAIIENGKIVLSFD